jgi:sialate O-acetylesterase
MKKFLLLFSIVLTVNYSYSNITLPKIFGDNMVLQRDKLIPVWGWAEPAEKITIRFNKQTKTVVAGKDGKWKLNLNAEKAGGPYNLVASGNNTIQFKNVMVGEVWICSGQSNMEMPIAGWGKINNYEQEIAAANYPQIRHIKIPNRVSGTPQEDIETGEWKEANPQNAGEFTAVGYFFARELYNQLKVPIGLVNTSWGGTMVETWISRGAFEGSSEFKNMIAPMRSLDLDSLAKLRTQAMIKKIEAAQGPLVSKEVAATWSAANTDISDWKEMNLPALWEGKGLNGLDGVVWFRKLITVSAENAGKPATLELAMIDDNDITYINGLQVGSTTAYNLKRKYTIPAGVLKEGINSIAIRVEDTGGGGGVYGEAGDMKISFGNLQQSISGDWLYKVESITKGGSVGPNDYPTLLYNAMIYPLVPFGMRGVLWYQGEANANRAYQYRTAFPLMIKDWRSQWKQGDFPFYFVQLASFNAGGGNSKKGSNWAELREAQALTLSLPNTGMAVTTDIGNAKDIHPKNKQDVGKRLAAIALHQLYGKNIVSSGPVYSAMKVSGNMVTLSFTSTGSGLMAKGADGKVWGFEVAGDDKLFYPATAVIKGNTVVVSSNDVGKPVAVRYGWANDAGAANLFNKEGFPAPPFRTDNWKGVTEAAKFALR